MEWLITNAVAALLMPPGILLVLLLIAAVPDLAPPPARAGPRLVHCRCALRAVHPLRRGLPGAVARAGTARPARRQDRTGYRGAGRRHLFLRAGVRRGYHQFRSARARALRRSLHRALKKPILASGGAPEAIPRPKPRLMKQVLQREFQVPVAWIEDASRNTLENARASYQILDAAGIRRVYLVTHAWHMPRARLRIRISGLQSHPCADRLRHALSVTVFDFVPRRPGAVQQQPFLPRSDRARLVSSANRTRVADALDRNLIAPRRDQRRQILDAAIDHG